MRSLAEIVADIDRDMDTVACFGAKPYLDAMRCMVTIDDDYGCDSGRSVVLYFLSNAHHWRGPIARTVKAELKEMLKNG